MRNLQQATKQQTTYRACRKALNNLGKARAVQEEEAGMTYEEQEATVEAVKQT